MELTCKRLYRIIIIFFIISAFGCSHDQTLITHFNLLAQQGDNLKIDSIYLNQFDEPEKVIVLASVAPSNLTNANTSTQNELVNAVRNLKSSFTDDYVVVETDSLYRLYQSQSHQYYYPFLELELLYLKNNNHNVYVHDKLEEIIEFRMADLNWKNVIHQYYILKYLQRKADLLHKQNKINESLATYHYALYLIDHNLNSSEYTFVRDELLILTATCIHGELSNEELYEEKIDHLMDLISKSGRSRFEYKKLIGNVLQRRGETDLARSTWERALDLATTNVDRFIANLSIGWNNYQVGQTDTALYFFKKSLTYLPQNSCSNYKFYPYLYIMRIDGPQESYLQELRNLDHCSDYMKDIEKFITPQYLRLSDLYKDVDSIVRGYLSQRKAAEKIFPGYSTLHLQDFYVQNLSNVYASISTNKDLQNGYWLESVIQLAYDTRNKETLRRKLSNNHIQEKTSDEKNVTDLLRVIQDFQIPLSLDRDIYKDLYDAYQLKSIETEYPETGKIDLKIISQRIQSENAGILNFTLFDSIYYYYLYDGKSIRVDTKRFSKIPFFTRIGKDLSQTKAGTQAQEISNHLGKMLGIHDYDKLYIITDGQFDFQPWPLIFEDKEIVVLDNVGALNTWEPITLSKNAVKVCSYSDESTIASSEKRVFSELASGYQECLDIQKLLELEDEKLISGGELDEEAMNEVFLNSIVHLSTHASTNFANRLDNYIAIRDDNGQGDKFYAYQIEASNEVPDVVILSACDTGLGVHASGTGIFSLSKAFLGNGASSVVKTLWKVNEKATSVFMVRMYQEWMKGKSLGEALSGAQMYFKTHPQYSHPYYWAGFVLEGNPNVYLEE